MKKMVLILLAVFVLFGCSSTPDSANISETEIPADKRPGQGEALITVNRIQTFAGSMISMTIWVNDEVVANGIRNGVTTYIVVPKGEYTIQAGSTSVDKGNAITFSINENEEVVFQATPAMGALAARFRLNEINRRIINQ